MNLKQLFKDDDAVSPVIGVILMVAITVILAAVIASFVLGLGDQAAQDTPRASFEFSYDSSAGTSGNDLHQSGAGNPDDGVAVGELTITHTGGDTIPHDQITTDDDDSGSVDAFSSDATAGSSASISIGNDDTVRIVYTQDGSDSTSILATYEAPGA